MIAARLITSLFFVALVNHSFLRAQSISNHCERDGKKLYGKVKVVTSFPDYKVKVVNSFPDLKVKTVSSFPDDCGEWQMVESFPDFTVQFVESFPDFTIQFVESFPGLGNGSVTSKPVSNLCTCKGRKLYGKVKEVSYGADFEVKKVDYNEDLRVKKVNYGADDCGEWEWVESGSYDFTIRWVDSSPDFTVRMVDSSNGLP